VGYIYSAITTAPAAAGGLDEFISTYKAKHDGKPPKISDLVNRRLAQGRNVSTEDISNALEAM
jgi:hypothetical protein